MESEEGASAAQVLWARLIEKRGNPPSVGGVLLRQPIGSGGMGVVFKGLHVRLGIPVAVKFLRPDGQRDEQQFINEAKLAARVNHPNVVRVYDVNSEEGFVYIIQEYVDGESAHEQFLERGPAAEAEVLNLAADTVRGLAAIHAEGLLHLDLKPANLLITRREGLAKILDLGLARPQGYIPEGRVFGTAGYVSPEQIMGFPATRASDLYGLGVTIYELLAGRHAYESSETMPRLARQLERELADIRTLRRDVSAATAELVKACVCMDPQQRPRSAAALLELLNAAWQALPARPAARMRPAGTTEVRSPQAPRVVSVDDDPKVCELLAAILREEGFEVEAFRDAHEALGILLRDPPCVAILDVEMPGLNGLEVCQELRRSPAGAQIPVVFLTGRMDPELVEEALKLGASDYLFKPFHAADLVARVRCLARIGETRRELAALDEQYRDFRKHLAGYEKGTAP